MHDEGIWSEHKARTLGLLFPGGFITTGVVCIHGRPDDKRAVAALSTEDSVLRPRRQSRRGPTSWFWGPHPGSPPPVRAHLRFAKNRAPRRFAIAKRRWGPMRPPSRRRRALCEHSPHPIAERQIPRK